MTNDKYQLAWNMFVELRKEVIATQQIRSQVIGFKITFVSTAIGVIVANSNLVSMQLLVVPAFAALFFDLLINSYGFSIKRIGYYCRTHLEPILKENLSGKASWNSETPLWEEFVSSGRYRQTQAIWGNLGITGLALFAAIIALCFPFQIRISLPLLVLLAVFTVFNIISFNKTDKGQA